MKQADVRTQLANYQTAVDEAKKQFDAAQKQASAMAAQGGQNAQQIQQITESATSRLSSAEAALNKYNAQIEIAAGEADDQIQTMSQNRDDLQAVVSKLQGQLTGLKSEEDSVQQYISQNMQMQLAQIQGQQQGGSAANVNKIAGGASNGNGFGGGRSSRNGGLGAAGNAPARGTLTTAGAK